MLHSAYVERDELGNGRIRDTIALKPIAHRVNGSMRRMTNLLTASGDPAMPIGCDELCQFRVDPRIAGKSPLIHFGKGSSFVKVALLNANNVSGTVNGNAITFVNAWNGADVTYRNGGHRLQEDILLKAGHPRSFAFRLDSHAGFNPETMTFGNDFRILDPVLEKDRLSVPLKWLVTQQGGKWILTVNLPNDGKDYAGWVLDPTLTLQPDGTAGKDTIITAEATTRNYGIAPGIGWGEGNWDLNAVYRQLMQFDLSSIPAAATVTSAVLSNYYTSNYASSGGTSMCYRLKRAWVEGTRSNAEDSPATGATWVRYDTTNNWQTAGAGGANDREATDIGSATFTATETLNQFKTISLTAAKVQEWVSGAFANNGILIKTDAELNDLYSTASSDDADAAKRPLLTVEYTLPGGGGVFGSSVMHSAIYGQQLAR